AALRPVEAAAPAKSVPAAASQDIPPGQPAQETAPATPREPPVAKRQETEQDVWTGVERIVAVGDVHGDYEQFTGVLASAGLIDGHGDWTGGKTHLVQNGDIVDRGPDSRAVMDLLMKLEKQAAAAGGAVHALIGNHEAMNVYGDLRYVSPGEFASYAHGPDASRDVSFSDGSASDRSAISDAAKPELVNIAL